MSTTPLASAASLPPRSNQIRSYSLDPEGDDESARIDPGFELPLDEMFVFDPELSLSQVQARTLRERGFWGKLVLQCPCLSWCPAPCQCAGVDDYEVGSPGFQQLEEALPLLNVGRAPLNAYSHEMEADRVYLYYKDYVSMTFSLISPMVVIWIALLGYYFNATRGAQGIFATFLNFQSLTAPVANTFIVAVTLNEVLVKKFIYFRLLEHGLVFDWANYNLLRSPLLYIVLVYTFLIILGVSDSFSVIIIIVIQTGAQLVILAGLLSFEASSLISLNKFLEGAPRHHYDLLGSSRLISEERVMENVEALGALGSDSAERIALLERISRARAHSGEPQATAASTQTPVVPFEGVDVDAADKSANTANGGVVAPNPASAATGGPSATSGGAAPPASDDGPPLGFLSAEERREYDVCGRVLDLAHLDFARLGRMNILLGRTALAARNWPIFWATGILFSKSLTPLAEDEKSVAFFTFSRRFVIAVLVFVVGLQFYGMWVAAHFLKY
jgi:hypothetical protein